ncbi:hypothetical protein B0H13DRAFT_2568420 [Mycena leptocephala]|nr:hypothetical protein B0H13DRAFT_2568420 [Mycena leptocephala]
MSQTPGTIRDGPAPFSGEHDLDSDFDVPDLIVRSGDGVDLHVHKTILKFVSTFFRNMLNGAGNPTDPQRDGKPVVVLPESCIVLHRLLCLAYPGSAEHYSLTAQNLHGVWAVHEAADKYVFKGVLELLEKLLNNPILIDAQPHRIYAIAQIRSLPELARKAALATLAFPLCPPDLLFPELEELPALTFQRLHQFHHACGQAAESIVSQNSEDMCYTNIDTSITCIGGNSMFVWWDDHRDHSEECGSTVSSTYQDAYYPFTPAPWFRNHISVLAPKVRAIPTRHTVDTGARTLTDSDRLLTKNCKVCLEEADHDLALLGDQLGRRIETSNNNLVAAMV